MNHSLLLEAPLRRRGAKLLDLGLWCLGRDIAHASNLLLARGLRRTRPPEGRTGCSVYRARLAGEGVLSVWGFGVLCQPRAQGPAFFLDRGDFQPRLVEAVDEVFRAFEVDQLRPLRLPREQGELRAAREALAAVADWFAGHEAWIESQLGPGYRRACLAARRKRDAGPDSLRAAWQQLSQQLHRPESLPPPESTHACLHQGAHPAR